MVAAIALYVCRCRGTGLNIVACQRVSDGQHTALLEFSYVHTLNSPHPLLRVGLGHNSA